MPSDAGWPAICVRSLGLLQAYLLVSLLTRRGSRIGSPAQLHSAHCDPWSLGGHIAYTPKYDSRQQVLRRAMDRCRHVFSKGRGGLRVYVWHETWGRSSDSAGAWVCAVESVEIRTCRLYGPGTGTAAKNSRGMDLGQSKKTAR